MFAHHTLTLLFGRESVPQAKLLSVLEMPLPRPSAGWQEARRELCGAANGGASVCCLSDGSNLPACPASARLASVGGLLPRPWLWGVGVAEWERHTDLNLMTLQRGDGMFLILLGSSSLCPSVRLSVDPSIHLSNYLSSHPSISPSPHVFIHPSTHLFTRPPVHPFPQLPSHPHTYTSVHPALHSLLHPSPGYHSSPSQPSIPFHCFNSSSLPPSLPSFDPPTHPTFTESLSL